jgi:hypothetical protein
MLQAFDDFMSPKILFISLLGIIITLGVVFLVLSIVFEYSGKVTGLLPIVFTSIVQDLFEKIDTYPFLSFILEHKLLMSIFHFLLYLGIGVVIYYMFFTIYAFIISFFNTYFIHYIQKRYYVDVKLKGMNILSSLFFYVKTILITLILFIVLLPTYFIPVANILIFLPIYYFFHKTIIFDVSSVINDSREYKIIKRINWSELKAHTGFCFMLTLVPFFGILLFPYYILYLGHYIMQETKELRYVNDFHKK